MLSELQQYCLEQMGITIWLQHSKFSGMLVIVSKPLNAETQALLNKMIAALNWEPKQTRIETVETSVRLESKFKKVLVCGEVKPEYIQQKIRKETIVVRVSALEVLLHDVSAKKAAWAAMQAFKNPPSNRHFC